MPITRLETYSLDFVSRLSTTSMLSRLDFLLAVTIFAPNLGTFWNTNKIENKKQRGRDYLRRETLMNTFYCHLLPFRITVSKKSENFPFQVTHSSWCISWWRHNLSNRFPRTHPVPVETFHLPVTKENILVRFPLASPAKHILGQSNVTKLPLHF